MGHVAGFDVGSQSLKGVLVEPGGVVAAAAAVSYDMAFPLPGHAEQDASVWTAALASVTRQLLGDAGVSGEEVDTVAVAAQVDGFLPVDGDGRPLAPAVIWMDRRAVAECDRLSECVSAEDVFRITGLNCDAAHVAPKIMWLRANRPDVFSAARWFPSPASFLVEWLTGERVIDPTNASSTMVYDVARREWSPELLQAAGLVPEQLGTIVESAAVVGGLSPRAVSALGLSSRTAVVAGCGDDFAACLGAGLVAPGVIGDVVGTAEPIAGSAAVPRFDETRLLETREHAVKGLWLLQNPGFVSGGSVRWWSEVIGVRTPVEFCELASQVPAGADGVVFLPCLGGATTPEWNGHARGAFCGMTLSHDRRHLARAVIEGCCFAFRDITDRLAEMEVVSGQDIRVVGGGAVSSFWCETKADVAGRPLRSVRGDHATAVGAAMLAGVAGGEFDDLAQAADAMVRLDRVYEPSARAHERYEASYGAYRQAFSSLQDVGWAA